ncbi:MAG: hypothetical protein AB4368_21980 [Xenococcaceae cyanobacterium]
MFSFVAIFIFILFWIYILIKIVDLIFSANRKIKGKTLSLSFISLSLIMSFIGSMISFYLVIIFLINLPIYLGFKQKIEPISIVLSTTDCLTLTEAIQQTDSQIDEQANHRFLEETAHLFTIKIEYQKVADKLKEQAQIYRNLSLSPEGQSYARQISQKFQALSELFIQRNTITPNKEGIKKVYKLLERMDELDRERLLLVNQVKQQCNNTT